MRLTKLRSHPDPTLGLQSKLQEEIKRILTPLSFTYASLRMGKGRKVGVGVCCF